MCRPEYCSFVTSSFTTLSKKAKKANVNFQGYMKQRLNDSNIFQEQHTAGIKIKL